MKRLLLVFPVLWWLALGSPLGAQPTFKAPPPRFADPDRRSKLAAAYGDVDRVFQDFVAKAHVPGAAWGIVIDGELAHSGVAGVRDVEGKAPVTLDTAFRIASMTKSFTAISILKLRDEGKLSLDDPAERYVPELQALVYPTTDSPHITIRHLLSHAEGFPEDNPWGDRQLADSDAQLTEMLRGGIPFSNSPGVAYEYSNYGFAILGRIVSRVSGMPYTEYVASAILRPLGMTSTSLEPQSVPPDRLAHGYRWEDDRWKDEPLLANGSFGSMGGMITTVPDLARYVAAFLGAWPPRDGAEGPPLRRSSLREMQQVWRPAPGSVTRDAWVPSSCRAAGTGSACESRRPARSNMVVAHSGGLPGFGSQMRWLPEYRRRDHRLWQSHLHRLGRRGRRRARRSRAPAPCSRGCPSQRRRSSPLATPWRSWWSSGTIRRPTGSPPATCSSTRVRIGGVLSSPSCTRPSARAPQGVASTPSRTRCAGTGR